MRLIFNSWSINDSCIHCGHCVAICPEKAVTPDNGDIIPLVEPMVQPADFIHLTAGVRSCRKYKSKPVPAEMLQMLVENMKNYPSASNKRSLKITIVKTPEKIQLLNDMTAGNSDENIQIHQWQGCRWDFKFSGSKFGDQSVKGILEKTC